MGKPPSWKCEVCGKYIEKEKRIRHRRFCSRECEAIVYRRRCRHCKIEFIAREYKQELCPSCSSNGTIGNFYWYRDRIYEKKCAICGAVFMGRKKKSLCTKCYIENRQQTMVHHYSNIERPILCSRCGEAYQFEIVNATPYTFPSIIKGHCQKCKDEISNSRKNKINALAIKPQKIKVVKIKVVKIAVKRKRTKQPSCQKKSKEEKEASCKRVSERMKTNNPMKNPEYVKRMLATCNKRRELGIIKMPTGPQHGNWRGNRGFNLDCRSRLYRPWIRPILIRDQFHCVWCGTERKLQVHHIRPLQEIIDRVLGRYPLFDIDQLAHNNPLLYEQLIQDVIAEHKLSDGIVVCKGCHAMIDKRYRIKNI